MIPPFMQLFKSWQGNCTSSLNTIVKTRINFLSLTNRQLVTSIMIQNYFKTALRNLWKTRGYNSLNIFGLAVGIAAASLIFLWVEDEVGYNNFPNKEDIYIVKSKLGEEGNRSVSDAVPGPLGPSLKSQIPGIRFAGRVVPNMSYLLTIDDVGIYQIGHAVDPDFINIFSLKFIEGAEATAMDSPNDLIITRSTANRIFGNEPALGKSIRINEEENCIVSGVVEDLPMNSTIQFDWLISYEAFENKNEWVKDWKNAVVLTYVQLEASATLTDINKKLGNFEVITAGETQNFHNFLYPMDRWRLYNSFDRDGNEQEGRMKYVRLFTAIAWVALLIACINFMNLATARSEKRAKEVGMRKVVGANKISLIGQFLGESIIIAAISALLAIGFVYLSIGAFNNLVEKELVVNLLQPTHAIFIVGIILVCGLLSGIYPAFYLSSFNPLITLKGVNQKSGGAGFIRRGLVILQYAAAITLITCSVIIFQQIQYIKGRDIGFEISQVITVPLRGHAMEHLDVIKDQLMATGNLEHVGLSSGDILNIGVKTSMDWPGKDPREQMDLWYMWADGDFVPTMGMKLVDGRSFKPQLLGDSSSIIVNETFAKHISADGKAAGKVVYWDDVPYTVVGVVKDFAYNNIYNPADAMFFRPFTLSWGMLYIKTKKNADLTKAVSQIEQIIRTNNPGYPVEYRFLDDIFNEKFKSEMLIQKLAGLFAALSIVISCLGLFGLAAFTAERRTKEVGIRKVLGATTSSLVGMLNKEFFTLVLVSCALAFPITWWIMSGWLGNYQYHTDLHWWVFLLSGSGALVIALFTVSSQILKIAYINPTKSLREE